MFYSIDQTSGAPDGEYHLTKFEYSSSSLGREKYTGLCYIFDVSLSLPPPSSTLYTLQMYQISYLVPDVQN